MRSIGFRAWDKEAEKMFIPLSIRWDIFWGEESGKPLVSPAFNIKTGLLEDQMTYPVCVMKEAGHYKECPLMQYTGLKDKNDKEIYEGDVLIHQMYSQIVVKDLFEFFSYTIPDVGRYQWKGDGKELGFEIIGNIYEHPELIDKDGQKEG